MANGPSSASQLRPQDVRRLCGELLDWKVQAIVDTGASLDDVEVAVAWLTGADDVMGEARTPLEGKAAQVFDLIAAGEEFPGGDEAQAGRREA